MYMLLNFDLNTYMRTNALKLTTMKINLNCIILIISLKYISFIILFIETNFQYNNSPYKLIYK